MEIIMSETSDQYERDVANHINGTIKGLMAERPKVSTSFPDVRMKYKNLNEIWLEVKMNHTDNMMNPRFSYVDGKWITPESYKSPGTDKLCEYWNASQEAKTWIDNLKIHLLKNNFKGDVSKISLYSSKTERKKDSNSIYVDEMKGYLETLTNKNICKVSNVNVGELATLHYLKGKAAIAYYLSSGDDFYQFGTDNPFRIPYVPVFATSAGTNDIVLRVGDRSSNFEIQAEVKARFLQKSTYSVKPGSAKLNPFRFIDPKL
jgi:hypothetical protein